MISRDRLICCLVGKYSVEDKTIDAQDLRIRVDQHLISCNLLPLGDEPGDVELMEELMNETILSVLNSGKMNRRARRSHGV